MVRPSGRSRRPGNPVDAVVQNHDILPTVCDIMGFDTPEYAEGTSFWPVIQGKQNKIRDYANQHLQRVRLGAHR